MGRLGDGWMAMVRTDEVVVTAPQKLATIRAAAAAAGRDPLGLASRRLSDPLDLESSPDASPGCVRQASPGSRWACRRSNPLGSGRCGAGGGARPHQGTLAP